MKDCADCEYYDLSTDDEPCVDCWKTYEKPSFAKKSDITLESINAKLDKIMAHLGIEG